MKKKIQIVFLDRDTFPKDIVLVKPKIPHTWMEFGHTTATQVVSRARNAEVIITNKVPITASAIEKLPALEMISVTATGTNNIDHRSCHQHGIAVKNVVNYGTDSVAEHCWCLILNLFRQFLPYRESILKGDWSRSKGFSYFLEPVRELAGARLGIIGPGVLGRRVGELAAAFKTDVVYVSNPRSQKQVKKPNLQFVTLDQALRTSDVISIHCPMNEDTRNLITLKEMKKMKKTAFLINTSRGGIVNEEDLAESLRKKIIGGAAFDVLSTEPPPPDHILHQLREHPRFILTPHIAWIGQRSVHNLVNLAISNVDIFYSSRKNN